MVLLTPCCRAKAVTVDFLDAADKANRFLVVLDNFVAWRLVLEALAILGMVLGLHRADDSLFYSLLLEMVRLRRGHGGTPVFHLEEQGVEPSFEPCPLLGTVHLGPILLPTWRNKVHL